MISVKRGAAVGMLLLMVLTPGTVSGQKQKPAMVVQMGHTDQVNSVAFSPDGKYALSGSYDNTIKLWDIGSGKEIRTFKGHNEHVSSVAFSPDGKYALSGSYDTTLKLWDIVSGKEIRTFMGHSNLVLSVAFSHDGKYALSGSADFTLKLWDIGSGKEIRSFVGHSDSVNSVVFLANKKYALSGSADNTIKLWDIGSGKEMHTFRGHRGMVFSVAVSSDDRYFLSSSWDTTVMLWDIAKRKAIYTFKGHNEHVSSVAFSPDRNYVVSSDLDTIKMWDIKHKKEICSLEGHLGNVLSVTFSPDGKYILSGSDDSTVRFWDVYRKKEIYAFSHRSSEITSLDVSSDGSSIVSGAWNGIIKLWDLATGKILKILSTGCFNITSVAFSHDNKDILFGTSSEASLRVWNVAGDSQLHKFLGHTGTVNTVAYSPKGEHVLSGATDNTIILWDVATGHKLRTFIGHTKPLESYYLPSVNSAVFSPHGQYVLSGGNDGLVNLWDIAKDKELCTFKGHTFYVQSAVFSPDNQYALSGSWDETLRLWDIETGAQLKIFQGHTGPVESVAYSPDGSYVLSGSWDKTVRLWNVSNGSESRSFKGHTDIINSVAFSPGGRYAVSGSSDGTIRVWNIETGEWVAFMANADGTEWLIFDSDGYWDASPNGGEMVAMVRGMECWNIDQFAVRNNRPDLILKKLPDPDPELIEHYRNQYLRRLRRLGLAEEDLSEGYHVPSAEIVESSQEEKYIDLRFVLEDDRVPLKSYNIYVNDVPVFGAYGKDLDDAAAGGRTALHERIELSAGENKIEVSCMNEAGAEAFRPVVYANYNGPVERDLYYIGFGVSEYRDESLDLRYAHKDAEDLGKLFGSLYDGAADGNYRKVITRTFTDGEVTRENIAAAKELLEQASVDDTVVLMISGHGVHDRDKYATYYYLTHETDLDNLAQTAVEFEELEELLQGIPPRRKLFLMDTCGSGEWDQETVRKVAQAGEAAAEEGAAGKGVWSRMPAGLAERGGGESEGGGDDDVSRGEGRDAGRGGKKAVRDARTYLADKDRYIYNDLVRRSGAIVFSSCRGDEVSYESAEYENGLFTEYILRALGGGGADEGPGKAGGRALVGGQGGSRMSGGLQSGGDGDDGGLQSGVGRGDDGSGNRPADTDGDGVVTTEELRQYVRSGVAAETKEDPLLYAVPQHPTVDRDNIYVEFGF